MNKAKIDNLMIKSKGKSQMLKSELSSIIEKDIFFASMMIAGVCIKRSKND